MKKHSEYIVINSLLVVSLLLPLLTISCFEEDEAVLPYPGKLTTIVDDIQYYQSYYDFETDTVVHTHHVQEWQLAFEAGEEGFHVLVNSGDFWKIAKTESSDFDEINFVPENIIWEYDRQKDYPDSTAVGEWVRFTESDTNYTGIVYLLGRGSINNFVKLHKLQFLYVDAEMYKIQIATLDDNWQDTITIVKDEDRTFTFFSIDGYQQVELEPMKTDFDLVFGPYFDTATQSGVTIPYLVRGALQNFGSTEMYLETELSFDQVGYNQINFQKFSSRRDVVGYNWKDPILDGSSAFYQLRPNYTYVIKTFEENYFKMRFLGYELNGDNGYPKFETVELSQN